MLTFEEWRHTYADIFETDDAARAAWTAASNNGYRAGAQDTRALLTAHSAGAQEPVAWQSVNAPQRRIAMLTPERIRDIAAVYSKDPHYFEFEANDFIAAARAIEQAARREALESCAKWYDEKGWLLDEGDVPDAIRALMEEAK